MREQYVNELLRKKVVITAALSGAATFKHQNEAVPYTPRSLLKRATSAGKRALPSCISMCGTRKRECPRRT